MKSLVYFASGNYKTVYQNLPFDRIYLVDNHHRNPYPINMKVREQIINNPFHTNKSGREIDKRRSYCSFNESPKAGDFDMTVILEYKITRLDNYTYDIIKSNPVNKRIYKRGKVYCLEMDCIEAVEYLKSENVIIDCFVCLNEGLNEGGGYYPINSDKFMERVNPILAPHYIHLMKKGVLWKI